MPSSKNAVFRKIDSIPTGWSLNNNVVALDKPNEPMQLEIYLKQPALEKFQKLAMRVSWRALRTRTDIPNHTTLDCDPR